MNNKKSQVTIFIILGIVILVVTLGIIYYSSSSKEKKIIDRTETINMIPSELQPLVNYMDTCVETVAKKGMFLLGSQGGLIYTTQGGNIQDYRDESLGTLYLEYPESDSRKVPYLIGKSGSSGSCISSLPRYPLEFNKYYPYGKRGNFSDEEYLSKIDYTQVENCFGRKTLSSLDSFLFSLKHYIESHVKTDCTFEAFKNFNVISSDATATIENTPSQTNIKVNYPLEITHVNTQARNKQEEFRAAIPLSLQSLREFTKTIIELDINDPKYNIRTETTDKAFNVFVLSDNYNHDDIIIISSDSFKLDGKKFEFVFARRNRPPALEYVYNTSFGEVELKEGDLVRFADVINQELAAVDPDEDEVKISVNVGKGTSKRELTEQTSYKITYSDAEECGFSECKISINITATDGEYTDYQTETYYEKFEIKDE
ncbi:MAG: hypothetical protein KAK00_09075 [Nanoarchaeota archaeon]|nr:hypothetical protein [Nanoarchaeota archaeon]